MKRRRATKIHCSGSGRHVWVLTNYPEPPIAVVKRTVAGLGVRDEPELFRSEEFDQALEDWETAELSLWDHPWILNGDPTEFAEPVESPPVCSRLKL